MTAHPFSISRPHKSSNCPDALNFRQARIASTIYSWRLRSFKSLAVGDGEQRSRLQGGDKKFSSALIPTRKGKQSTICRFLWFYNCGNSPVLEDLLANNRLVNLKKSQDELGPIGIGEKFDGAVDSVWMEILSPDLPKHMPPLAFACSVPAGNQILAKDLMLELQDEGRGSSVGKRDARNFCPSRERLRMLRDVGNFFPVLGLYSSAGTCPQIPPPEHRLYAWD